MTVGGQGKYFHVSIKISICRNMTCKYFDNLYKQITFFGRNDFLNSDFAIAREIIHDYAIYNILDLNLMIFSHIDFGKIL